MTSSNKSLGVDMNVDHLPNPVHQAYGGGDSLDVRRLQEFCARTETNFVTICRELDMQRLRLIDAQSKNIQLMQLLNWIATTNPQILDEFQTTATAFDKLVPRDSGDSDVACAQA